MDDTNDKFDADITPALKGVLMTELESAFRKGEEAGDKAGYLRGFNQGFGEGRRVTLEKTAQSLLEQSKTATEVTADPMTPERGDSSNSSNEPSDVSIATPIDHLELKIDTYTALRRAGINHVEQLLDRGQSLVLELPRIGNGRLDEIIDRCQAYGRPLKD